MLSFLVGTFNLETFIFSWLNEHKWKSVPPTRECTSVTWTHLLTMHTCFSGSRQWWRPQSDEGQVLHQRWVSGKIASRLDIMLSHDGVFRLTCDSRFRGSVRRAVTANITATLTSPVLLTPRTSAVSSTTAVTSSSGCTCGSTSCCDGRGKVLGQKDRTMENEKQIPEPASLNSSAKVWELLWHNRGHNTHALIVNTPWTQNFPWCKLSTWCRIFWWMGLRGLHVKQTSILTFSHTPSPFDIMLSSRYLHLPKNKKQKKSGPVRTEFPAARVGAAVWVLFPFFFFFSPWLGWKLRATTSVQLGKRWITANGE